jgi:glucosamine--fructose-6-phosphate aminotransferase (isomerizing)
VVAQLLEYYYRGDIMEALTKVLHRIEGAYALGIICADCPDRLIAARKDSPLILGYGEGCHFLASDVTAVIKYTREVCYLEDGEIAVLTADGITSTFNPSPTVEKKSSCGLGDLAAEKAGKSTLWPRDYGAA